MSYLVFARKYRPQTFSAVTGQEHITRSLANAIQRDKIAHAFLFAGPRGVGKTSIARIFAKSLNCIHGPTATPCLECVNCKEITEGTSLAVREMDGASNNSVDDVRDLIDSFKTPPPPNSKYKVYIIDEVHMLSISAFNALLKSLEEPPPNTIFILATTELHKIPETVLSRCQRHDFRALSFDEIRERLKEILDNEKVEIEAEALRMVAKLSKGSMRDAQSLLDRVASFCDSNKITSKETGSILGIVQRAVLTSLTKDILEKSPNKALLTLQNAFNSGVNITLFVEEFISYFREILISKLENDDLLLSFGLDKEEISSLKEIVQNVSLQDIQDLYAMLRQGGEKIIKSSYPKYSFEALVVKMATRVPTVDIAWLIASLRNRIQEGSIIQVGALQNEAQKKNDIILEKKEIQFQNKEQSQENNIKKEEISSSNHRLSMIFNEKMKRKEEEKTKSEANEKENDESLKENIKEDKQKLTFKNNTLPNNSPRDFEIMSFLQFLEEKKEQRLNTYLQRVSIVADKKEIKIHCSKFDARYFQTDGKKKFLEYLEEFTNQKNWKITVGESEEIQGCAKDSILGKKKEMEEAQSKENLETVCNDEAFMGIKEMFPGTTIDKIIEKTN